MITEILTTFIITTIHQTNLLSCFYMFSSLSSTLRGGVVKIFELKIERVFVIVVVRFIVGGDLFVVCCSIEEKVSI
mgnify:CR=1 FL=1